MWTEEWTQTLLLQHIETGKHALEGVLITKNRPSASADGPPTPCTLVFLCVQHCIKTASDGGYPLYGTGSFNYKNIAYVSPALDWLNSNLVD